MEDLQAELADVVITAYTIAVLLDFDLDEAMYKKLEIVFSRGWRQTIEETA